MYTAPSETPLFLRFSGAYNIVRTMIEAQIQGEFESFRTWALKRKKPAYARKASQSIFRILRDLQTIDPTEDQMATWFDTFRSCRLTRQGKRDLDANGDPISPKNGTISAMASYIKLYSRPGRAGSKIGRTPRLRQAGFCFGCSFHLQNANNSTTNRRNAKTHGELTGTSCMKSTIPTAAAIIPRKRTIRSIRNTRSHRPFSGSGMSR